jgi:D-alanyl-D-alanine carboxypeptidase
MKYKLLLIACLSFFYTTSALGQMKLEYNQDSISKIFKLIDQNSKKYSAGIQLTICDSSNTIIRSGGSMYEDVLVNDSTIFNIGSTTKLFVSTLILMAKEEKLLNLDWELSRFFDGSNKHVPSDLKIQELLNHTSGLGEFIIPKNFNKSFTDQDFKMHQSYLYDVIPKGKRKNRGTYTYCNSNYILLGYILEQVYTVPFSEILKTKITGPLGLNNTYAYYDKNIKNVAHSHIDTTDYYALSNNHTYTNFYFTAGGMASTTSDLTKFLRELLIHQSLINRDALMKFNPSLVYGNGIERMQRTRTVFYYGHSGDNIGFACRNFVNIESGLSICLLYNTTLTNATNNFLLKTGLIREIAQILEN